MIDVDMHQWGRPLERGSYVANPQTDKNNRK